MNKFITKVAKLTLGLAMAAGVGVAVGAGRKDASPVHADSATFVAGTDTGSGSVTKNHITVSTSTMNRTDNYRMNSGASLEISGDASVSAITTIELTCTANGTSSYGPGKITGWGGVGNYSYSGKVGTWTGSATSVTFSNSAQVRMTQIAVTYTASGGTVVEKTITGPSNMNKNLGDSSVDIANDIKVDGSVLSGCSVNSSNTTAVTVSGTTLSFVGEGSSTITISHSDVTVGTTTYTYANKTFTVTVTYVKSALPSMVSGDYGKITSSSDLEDGYYLLVCENSSLAFKGSASTLDGNTGYSVSISNDSIGSTSSTDAEAIYIKSTGQTDEYNVAAKVKYADNGYKFIGRTADSNGIDETNTPQANEITFDNDGHALITGTGGRRLCAYSNSTFKYYSKSNNANLYLYKKGNSSATFNVSYNANGNDVEGYAPTDSTNYATGATVTVLGNPGELEKPSFTWNGWNTSDDGTGTHYNEDDTFSISGNVILYAEWVKSLDSITAIGGTVTATLSQTGTYNWDFSSITVSGTLSGQTGQNVKAYVDLSSTTAVPASTGSCTVSVTATKKSTVPGTANPLTNNNISGEVEAPKLAYSFTMSYSDLTQSSYGTEDNAIKTSKATCTGHDDIEISWRTSNVQKNNNSGTYSMQFRGNPVGYLYNSTEIPGTITGISYNDTILAGSFTEYYGNSEHPTTSTTVGGKYFTILSSSSTDKVQNITVTFEVSDKPKVQLVASDINLDVADGVATPTVTDGTSAVSGYTLVSEDSYIASITNDNKVQPVGYGKVSIAVTKAEDSGHIYLATTFTVAVGDHSKETSIMNFTEAAGGSATAADSVVWTITSNASENAFSEVYGINFGTNGSKVSSLTLTTPADEERIIKNVVVEAMSNDQGSNIAVTIGSTSFTCSKSTALTGTVTTYNFSGNLSGAITISISGTQSSKYGVKSIAVLYVGDEATSYASTFLGAISCTQSGTSKPTFNFQPGSETRWTWTLLATEFSNLDPTDQAKFAKGATGVSSTVTECVERYDYIVGKYFVGELDTTLISSDFMGRNPSPVGTGGAPLLFATNIKNTNTIAIIVIISMVSVTAIGGYFFLRKRKEQ